MSINSNNDIEINPAVLRWALDRAKSMQEGERHFDPKYEEWADGESVPTFSELRKFSKSVRLPLAVLVLSDPVTEILGISDFRSKRESSKKPSTNLIEVVRISRLRMAWLSNYRKSSGDKSLGFVNSLNLEMSAENAALQISTFLNMDLGKRAQSFNSENALRDSIDLLESHGFLINMNGVVGNNTRRVLDLDEFRGFSISDSHAPLIFINAKDSPAARLFTLFHEVAHIFLGDSGISNAGFSINDSSLELREIWCNRVAAELLVPADDLRKHFRQDIILDDSLRMLRARYKVSSAVIAIRLFQIGMVSNSDLKQILQASNEARAASLGGNFYALLGQRVSRELMRNVSAALQSESLLYSEAHALLGVPKAETLERALTELQSA